MYGLGQTGPYAGLGGSQWTAAQPLLAAEVVLPCDPRAARRLIRQRCPAAPGVYGMIDAEGQLIYVGKSRALRSRLVTYFYEAAAHEKAGRIIAHTERLVWEPAGHEFAALVRELELIRRWRPRFNVQGQPGRLRRVYVCLSGGAAPHVFVAPRPTVRASHWFGPLRGGKFLRAAVEQLNHYFQLRDCAHDTPLYFLDQRELFDEPHPPRCLRMELGSCLAPCAAHCSTQEYAAKVAEARAFLRGEDTALLAALEDRMHLAAHQRRFELAAQLRNAWNQLSYLHAQLDGLRRAKVDSSFVYPLPGHARSAAWYLIRRGEVAGVLSAPRDRRAALRCRQRLKEVYGATAPSSEAPADDVDLMGLILRWFHQNPDELARTLSPSAAIAHCDRLLQRQRTAAGQVSG